MTPAPRLIAWEVTRRCNLRCRHCRAAAEGGPYAGELSFAEACAFVDDVAAFARPILILTGGEPLLRDDLFDLAVYAREKGLRPVLGTNATLIDDACARRIAACGITRLSVSLDFPTAADHDAFRGVKGAFDAALAGLAAARHAGLEVQVNTTVTRLNRHHLPALHDLAVRLGAQAFHPFLLVPTGRGADLRGEELSAVEYEETLRWVYETQKTSPLVFKPTDAPQYQRVMRERCTAEGCPLPIGGHGLNAATKGCLAGTGFAFVSHVGDVQPCGYFDLKVGSVRERPFSEIWATSPVLDDLRHPDRLKGKCGVCAYKAVCGGCRARALAKTGDYLAEEPYCAHVPDRALLDRVQLSFPLVERPYVALGAELGLDEETCFARICALRERGLLRRVGAFFDAGRLGYASTLVTFAVAPERLDAVAARVAAEPLVTHDYARDGRYNLWFTLIAPSRAEIDRVLGVLQRETGVRDVLDLPAVKVYKLRVTTVASPDGVATADLGGRGGEGAVAMRPFDPSSPADIAIVHRLQGDILDLGLTPFAGLSRARVGELLVNGTIRRMGAVINHRSVGLAVNALTAWSVPSQAADCVGATLARFSAVSHCYARVVPVGRDWPYALYAMVHARTEADLDALLREMALAVEAAVGRVPTFVTLKTLREYKKTSMRYFCNLPPHAREIMV